MNAASCVVQDFSHSQAIVKRETGNQVIGHVPLGPPGSFSMRGSQGFPRGSFAARSTDPAHVPGAILVMIDSQIAYPGSPLSSMGAFSCLWGMICGVSDLYALCELIG